MCVLKDISTEGNTFNQTRRLNSYPTSYLSVQRNFMFEKNCSIISRVKPYQRMIK